MGRIQAQREIELTTPLGEDVLLFRRMIATEELGRLFLYELELLSDDDDLQAEDILGLNVTVRLNLSAGGQRFFNGHVTRFAHVGHFERFSAYEATVRPWFWFLTRTADCRIFQDKTVPDIVKELLQENGYSDFDDRLTRRYRTWTYCVQYRETDFDFLSRLMEQEGFYYYFRHDDGKHTLVLSDSVIAHDSIPNYENVPFRPPDSEVIRRQECIFNWSASKQICPGTYVLDDYDFKKPRVDLHVQRSLTNSHAEVELEVFDYPGEYLELRDGDEYVRTRLEELEAGYEWISAAGNTRGLFPGGLFALQYNPRTLQYNPRSDDNQEYLIVSAVHALELGIYGSTDDIVSAPIYDASYTAIPSDVTYRSASITPKPMVQGPQTAVVVGPQGQEIYTDKYGRVKVQFHWDRYGRADENSSCWMRVSQTWAGRNWGAIALPRIGQEVLVDFLEGDPDDPIITGRVYNAIEMPPYELPNNATQSGVKSHSSMEGSPTNFNELRFEDKKGREEVYFHAERDFNRVVENNDSLKVGFEDKDPGNQSIQIHNSQSLSVGANQTETIGNNRTITIKKGDDSLEVQEGKRTVTVKGDNKLVVQTGESRFFVESGNHFVKIKGSMDVKAEDSIFMDGKDGARISSPDWVSVIGNAEVILRSNSSIRLICGNSSITMTPATIEIEAPIVSIKGTPVKINC